MRLMRGPALIERFTRSNSGIRILRDVRADLVVALAAPHARRRLAASSATGSGALRDPANLGLKLPLLGEGDAETLDLQAWLAPRALADAARPEALLVRVAPVLLAELLAQVGDALAGLAALQHAELADAGASRPRLLLGLGDLAPEEDQLRALRRSVVLVDLAGERLLVEVSCSLSALEHRHLVRCSATMSDPYASRPRGGWSEGVQEILRHAPVLDAAEVRCFVLEEAGEPAEELSLGRAGRRCDREHHLPAAHRRASARSDRRRHDHDVDVLAHTARAKPPAEEPPEVFGVVTASVLELHSIPGTI